MIKKECYTVSEYAIMLGVSVWVVYGYIKSGSVKVKRSKSGRLSIIGKDISKVHNLSDSNKYPKVYPFISSRCINIFSRVKIKPGDKIKHNGKIFTLGTNRELEGSAKKTNDKEVSFYEFTYN